jgi:hypothetical protein
MIKFIVKAGDDLDVCLIVKTDNGKDILIAECCEEYAQIICDGLNNQAGVSAL